MGSKMMSVTVADALIASEAVHCTFAKRLRNLDVGITRSS